MNSIYLIKNARTVLVLQHTEYFIFSRFICLLTSGFYWYKWSGGEQRERRGLSCSYTSFQTTFGTRILLISDIFLISHFRFISTSGAEDVYFKFIEKD